MSRYVSLAAAAAVALSLSLVVPAGPANALSVTFELDREFSGATDPAGGTPWVTVTFDDIAGGGVRMTIDTLGLVGDEFLSQLYFNIDPFLTPTSTTLVSGVAADETTKDGVTTAAISYGENAFKADGDGYFDALFNYAKSGAGIFGASMTSVYDLLHADLSVSDIIARSLGAGNSKDGLFVAAHIQGIEGGGSGWITGDPTVIPLPAGLLLLLTGLAGVGALGRYKAKRREVPTA